MVDYSIIVPAFNEEELLPISLGAIGRAMAAVDDLAGELIVVDNASTDATAYVAREHGARVVFEPHRQIARARNRGAAAARGRHLLFVDADTLIPPALLRSALAALEAGRFCGGGARIDFDGKLPPLAVAFDAMWGAMSRLLRWAAGCCIFSRRDAFEAVGGFDERFYASEEIHFSRALRRWGLRHGCLVIILDEAALTSMRKLRWSDTGTLVRHALKMMLNPRLLMSREGCHFWYERPDAGAAVGP